MLFPFQYPFSSLKHRSIINRKGQVHEKHRGWKSKDCGKNFGLRKDSDMMLCYVMLCYVMLCYVMLCYVMLCYVMLCYVMLCYVIYLLTAIGLTPSGSSTVHIYT